MPRNFAFNCADLLVVHGMFGAAGASPPSGLIKESLSMRTMFRVAFVVGALVSAPAFAEDPKPAPPAAKEHKKAPAKPAKDVAKDAPAKDAPAKDAPAADVAKDAPAKDAAKEPAKDAAKEAPAKDAAKEAPAKDAAKAPAKKTK
jgi:hypothetical protein